MLALDWPLFAMLFLPAGDVKNMAASSPCMVPTLIKRTFAEQTLLLHALVHRHAEANAL